MLVWHLSKLFVQLPICYYKVFKNFAIVVAKHMKAWNFLLKGEQPQKYGFIFFW